MKYENGKKKTRKKQTQKTNKKWYRQEQKKSKKTNGTNYTLLHFLGQAMCVVPMGRIPFDYYSMQ